MSRQNIYDHPDFYAGYRKLRESKITLNRLVEEPAMKSLLPSLNGLRIVDLGCGAGSLCRYFAEQGAGEVVGVDISSRMLHDAIDANESWKNRIRYRRSSMEDITFPSNSIDLVVSSLAFHYVADYKALIAKIADWLTRHGFLVFSIEHPIMTGSPQRWIKDDANRKLHWPVDRYSLEGKREYNWFVDGVIKYHRRFDTIVNDLIAHSLMVVRLLEPIPHVDLVDRNQIFADERIRPSLLLLKAKKIGGPA